MAEKEEDKELTVGKEVTIKKDKSPEPKGEAAPVGDKPVENPDEDDFSAVINVLNEVNKEVLGGTEEITELSDQAKAPIKHVVELLVFMKDLYEDPLWAKIIDDLVDQKEEGKTPSVLVAFARNVPMNEFEALADNEDYNGAQQELSDRLSQEKINAESLAASDAALEESLESSRQAGQDYAKKMGYSEEETASLFDEMLQLYSILGDGVVTEAEWEKFDKMRNYDSDITALREQIDSSGSNAAKEVLPDQASVDAVIEKKPNQRSTPVNQPGMASMMDQPVTTNYASRPRK